MDIHNEFSSLYSQNNWNKLIVLVVHFSLLSSSLFCSLNGNHKREGKSASDETKLVDLILLNDIVV